MLLFFLVEFYLVVFYGVVVYLVVDVVEVFHFLLVVEYCACVFYYHFEWCDFALWDVFGDVEECDV